jgi:hypothetical protein
MTKHKPIGLAVTSIMTASALSLSTVAGFASSAEVLKTNQTVTGDRAWLRAGTLALDWSYSGQGLTGAMHTQFDLAGKGFRDSYEIGPTAGANGFDGANAWQQEQSGIVSDQKGGDVLPLAFNEAYRDVNLWWRNDNGGARIDDEGRTTDQGLTYDVLKVSPPHGKSFEAWFDGTTHFLARTVEVQGSQTITTFYSDYASVEGLQIARKIVVDDGSGAKNRQTQSLTAARVLPRQPRSRYEAPNVSLHDSSIGGGAAETTVPFRLINNHIYADVSVNGAKPELFIFDTGGHDILSTSLAAALALKATGSQTQTGGGAGFSQAGTARVNSLSVGDATIRRQPVSVAAFFAALPVVEGVNARGMIGYEFFARFVTQFDYDAHTITFIDPKRFDPKDAGIAVPVKFFGQMPVVDGSFDGIPKDFHIDTGARMPLMLTGPFVAAHNLGARYPSGIEAMTGIGIGGPSFSFVTRGVELKIGGVTVDKPLTMFNLDKGGSGAAEAFPSNIGAGILKRFVVTLDYLHYVMYLKPVPGPVPDLDAFDRSGMWINGDESGFKIAYVLAGTPAEQAGLKAGDIIVAVDGTPASRLHLYDVRERLRDDAPGTVVRLSIRRGGETKQFAITLRDLI